MWRPRAAFMSGLAVVVLHAPVWLAISMVACEGAHAHHRALEPPVRESSQSGDARMAGCACCIAR